MLSFHRSLCILSARWRLRIKGHSSQVTVNSSLIVSHIRDAQMDLAGGVVGLVVIPHC